MKKSSNMETSITLKSIDELRKEKFIIPAYQRGYRWGERQVKELLNDLKEFMEKEKQKAEFYCLQPLVITQNKGKEWEVIDGQQRITTTFLILNFLNQRYTEERQKQLYTINYQTRKKSLDFLRNPDPTKQNENIDFYHIYNAYEVIREWFKDRESLENDFESTLLNRTKFIWYEVQINDDSDAIDIFTRINIGKIPLTNGELIKALFLNRSNFRTLTDDNIRLKQLQIAQEWDRIESTLQEDSFWYFIHDDKKNYSTRIELIFNLLVKKSERSSDHDDPYFTFIKYKESFDEEKSIDNSWKEIKDYFLTFDEWYHDNELYHLIGFLIAGRDSLLNIIKNKQNKRKTEFKTYLKSTIKSRIKTDNSEVEGVEYGDKRIKALLLLFNVVTIISNHLSDMRFPFDKFKIENWDIEHIRALADNKPHRVEDQKRWLRTLYNNLIDGQKVTKYLSNLLSETRILLDKEQWEKDDKQFDELYRKWLKHFEEEDNPEWINSIGNLTLLDQETNRSYKNAVFSIKRNVIIEKDKTVTFVPVCTKNVFLKYYSQSIGNMQYWSEDDSNSYIGNIKDTLKEYLTQDTDE